MVRKTETQITIHELGFKILNNWLKLKHQSKTLQKYFDDNYIKTVAIYGMGELGKRLFEDLKSLNVEVTYAIDINAENIDIDGLEIFTLDNTLPKVDVIIITPVHLFYEIEDNLLKKGIKDVISLEDLVVYCL